MTVLDEASMKSLFSSMKVIVLNNFNIDKISDYEYECFNKFIENNIDDVYLIFICDKIDARKKSYKIFKDNFSILELDKVDNLNIIDYVKNRIKDNGYKIDDIQYLCSKLGNDINNINNELDKLFMYKLDNKVINSEDIDLLIFEDIENIIINYKFVSERGELMKKRLISLACVLTVFKLSSYALTLKDSFWADAVIFGTWVVDLSITHLFF